MRDDFSEPTKTVMAQRVGYRCSNPDCMVETVGPNTDPDKRTLIGVAAHITAASPNGPRYNPKLTESERSDISNGIWLCQTCSVLVDRDPDAYPVELLLSWKDKTETIAREKLRNRNERIPIGDQIPYLEMDISWEHSIKTPRGPSPKNLEVFGSNAIPSTQVIYYNDVKWKYKLSIYNNSSFPAYNVKILEDPSFPTFTMISRLDRVNNLPALEKFQIEVEYKKFFEGTGSEACRLVEQKIPSDINGKKLILEYRDDLDRWHKTLVTIYESEIINKRG